MPKRNYKLIILAEILILSFFCSYISYAQNVIIYNVNGERMKGSLVETELTIKTESGEKKISISDIAFIDFASEGKQVSARAFLHLLRGQELAKAGFDEEALEELKTAVAQSPKYTEALFELGKILYKTGNKNEAMEYLSKIADEKPDYPEIQAYLKDIGDWYLVNKKDNAKSAYIYQILFDKYPKDKNAQFAIYKAGFIYAWELKDNKNAVSSLEKAVKAFPDDQNAEKALYEIGRLYIDEGKFDLAEAKFNEILMRFPLGERSDNAYYSLAVIYQQKNQYARAMQEIDKVMNYSSDQELIESAKKLVDELAWNVYGVLDGLPSENINCLAMDKNILWIGTTYGMAKFDLNEDRIDSEIILPNMEIVAISFDEDHLWIGTANSGIKQYDKKNKIFIQNPKLEDINKNIQRIKTISADRDSVWIGTESGVYQYDRISDDWSYYTSASGLPDNIVLSIASTPRGVWCGSKKGASAFDYSTGKWNIQSKLSNKSISNIAYADSGIWFGWHESLRNGVSRYDIKTQTWKEWIITEWEASSDLSKLGGDTSTHHVGILCIGARDGETWIGTESVTIYYGYQTSKWSLPLNYPSRLSGYIPSNIVIDDDSVWFAMPKGLGRLNKRVLTNR